MAAPNIVNVSQIYGQTKGADVTTSQADLLENSAGSGTVIKVNTLLIANQDGSVGCDVIVKFADASASVEYPIANTINVPADATLAVITKDTAIYLEEGDKITVQASANGDLVATISYEVIR